MANNISNVWKLMGIDPTTGTGTYKNRMGLGNAITRDNGIPLDLSALHATYNDAVVYAATSSIAYVGQPIAAEGVLYLITEESQGKVKISSYRDSITGKLVSGEEKEYDVYLKRVGIVPTGDNASVVVSGEGLVKLFAFDGAQAGAVPVKEDGKLVWKTLEEIGAGDGNDNTTYEFEVCEHKTGIVITPLFNGQPIMEGEGEETKQVKYHLDLDVYTKAEVDAAIKVVADKVGVPAEGDTDTKTLYERIAAEILRATQAEGALSDRIGVAKDGETAATGVYAYVDGVVNALVNGVDPDKIDSLNELIAWVEAHPDIVSGLDERLDAVEGILDGIGGEGEKATVKAYVDDAISAHEGVADGKYATKQEIADAGYAVAADVERDYAKKATTLAGYGITDAYTKTEIDNKIGTPGVPAVKDGEGDVTTEAVAGTGVFANTYSKAELNALLDEIEGGSTESAASVARQLDEYKTSNNQRVANIEAQVGKDINGEEPATGLFLEVDEARKVADEAKSASTKNAGDITALTGQLGTTNENVNGILTRLGALETEVGVEEKSRIDVLEGVLNGAGETDGLVKIVTGHGTRIGALEAADIRIEKKADDNAAAILALQNKVDTGDKTVKTYVDDAVKAVADTIDFTPYAKTEDVAKTYATIEALNAEAERADAAEKVNAKAVADLAAGAVKKNTDDIAAINALLNTVDSEDTITSLKELAIWVEEHDTEVIPVINEHTEAIEALEGKMTTVETAVNTTLPGAIAQVLVDAKAYTDEKVVKADGTSIVNNEGTFSVGAVSTDNLVQGTMTLVLNGGDAKVTA